MTAPAETAARRAEIASALGCTDDAPIAPHGPRDGATRPVLRLRYYRDGEQRHRDAVRRWQLTRLWLLNPLPAGFLEPTALERVNEARHAALLERLDRMIDRCPRCGAWRLEITREQRDHIGPARRPRRHRCAA